MALVTNSSTHITAQEQARHYFLQPHEGAPSEPVQGASAWHGQALRETPQSWTFHFSAAHIAELNQALEASSDFALGDIDATNFPLSTLTELAKQWRATLDHGRGFVLLRGLPVTAWGDARTARAYWGLGQHIGLPGAQNPEGELLGHVQDYGEQGQRPEVRLYRTRSNIRYHCDAADVVGLLCIRPAQQGGASRIVSSVAIFNEIFNQRPDLISRLFKPFMIDARGEHKAGQDPWNKLTPCAWSGYRLHTFFHSDYFRSVQRFDSAPEFTDQEQQLLDLYESIGNDPNFYLDMNFEPGDIQLVSNHTVLHARTAYEDWPDPAQRRHLLRLWLTLA